MIATSSLRKFPRNPFAIQSRRALADKLPARRSLPLHHKFDDFVNRRFREFQRPAVRPCIAQVRKRAGPIEKNVERPRFDHVASSHWNAVKVVVDSLNHVFSQSEWIPNSRIGGGRFRDLWRRGFNRPHAVESGGRFRNLRRRGLIDTLRGIL